MSRIPDPSEVPMIRPPLAAEILGVHVRTIYNQIDAGQMPCIRVGRAVRIPTAQFLARYGLEPTAPEPTPTAA